jgi:hypothetical protein
MKLFAARPSEAPVMASFQIGPGKVLPWQRSHALGRSCTRIRTYGECIVIGLTQS